MPNLQKYHLLDLFIFIAILGLCAWFSTQIYFQPGTFGNIDFVENWSAAVVYRDGGDFYDPSLVEAAQSQFHLGERFLAKWYPPWFTTFLSPLINCSITEAARRYFLLNIACLLASTFLSLKAFTKLKAYTRITILLFAAVLPATLVSLRFGQTGGLLALGTSMLLFGLVKNHPLVSGFGILLMSIKAHLFLLIPIPIAYWIVREKKWHWALWAILPLFIVFIIHLTIMPEAIKAWLASPFAGRSSQVTALMWIPATMPGAIRTLFRTDAGETYTWPTLIVPLVTFFATVLVIRKQSRLDLSKTIPILLVISYLMAPYGWIFDQTIIIPAIVLFTVRAFAHNQWQLALTYLAICAIELYTISHSAMFHNQMWWFPVPILVLLTIQEIGIKRAKLPSS